MRHDRQGFRNAARHHGRSGFPVLLHRARWGHLWLRRLLEPHGGGHGLVITDGDLDRAFRAHNALAHLRAGRIEIRQVSVGADGAVADLLAFRVLVDELYVVVDVTPVLANVQPANTDDVFGTRADHPVGHVDLMRCQLSRQAAGIFAEQAPVVHALLLRIFIRLHHPAGIAVPLRVNMRDLA